MGPGGRKEAKWCVAQEDSCLPGQKGILAVSEVEVSLLHCPPSIFSNNYVVAQLQK